MCCVDLQLKLSGSAFLYICKITSPFHIQPTNPVCSGLRLASPMGDNGVLS